MIERYQSKEMKNLWSLESRYNAYLKVELASTNALNKLGVVPNEDNKLIQEKAKVNLNRILELEEITHHDVVAFTRQVSETLGNEAKWIHYGLTSTDVVDTANGYMLSKANDLIFNAYEGLINEVKRIALEYKETPIIGRTHGVHADITSFGFKFAQYYDMLVRNSNNLAVSSYDVEVGKISGAVGNYANIDPKVEEMVCEELGITSASISTQILSRDRYATYFSVLSVTASILELIATEIRNLARTEISEVKEYFSKGQKGSSAMPHKKNPVSCENICGLSRIVRGLTVSSFENINLWGERDISHSSAERIIFEDVTTLIEYMLKRMTNILKGLNIYPDKMLENINLTNKNIFSQRVMTLLINKGLTREQAYDLVQPLTFIASKEKDFKKCCLESDVMKHINKDELDSCFTFDFYFKNINTVYERLGLI